MISRTQVATWLVHAALACVVFTSCLSRLEARVIDDAPADFPDQEELEISCNSASYQFLPGDFNGCMGRKLWMNGEAERAERWLLLAAGWGDKTSQFLLGIGHFNGDGLALNRPLGYAWLTLASEGSTPENIGIRESAWDKLNGSERARATELLKQMRPSYADKVAVVRAERHYQRELNAVKRDLVYFRNTCIVGITAEKGSLVSGTPQDPPSCNSLTDDVVDEIQVQHDQYFNVFNNKGKVYVSPPVQLRERP